MSALKKVAVATTVVATATVATTAVARYTKHGRYLWACMKFGWNYTWTHGHQPSDRTAQMMAEYYYEKYVG